jgi:hypothetical protein
MKLGLIRRLRCLLGYHVSLVSITDHQTKWTQTCLYCGRTKTFNFGEWVLDWSIEKKKEATEE